MVRLIKIFLLFIWVSSFGQLSFYFNDKDFSITSVDYDNGKAILPYPHLTLNCYKVSKTDTILLYSSIGCTLYKMDNKSLILYVWVSVYYSMDCFCEGVGEEEGDVICMTDTSIIHNIKIKFTYTENKLICSLSDIQTDPYIDTAVRFKQALNAISSSKFCKLTSINKIFKKKCFNYTIDIIRKYDIFYYDIAIHYLKTNNKKALSRLSYNIKRYYVLYDIERRVPDPINYISNIIKYLWPMRNKEFINEDISIFTNNIKKIILLSYPDDPEVNKWK